jgi:hypothetical protein
MLLHSKWAISHRKHPIIYFHISDLSYMLRASKTMRHSPFEETIFPQMVKKFPAFYATSKFIIMFIRIYH